MNFDALIKQLKQINLQIDQFVIVSSGSLAARGIRDARDLDILVTEKLWNELSQTFPVKNEYGMDKIKVANDIEVLGRGSAFLDSKIATIEEIFESADNINGIRYMNLKLLRIFKEKMGREKDKKDIELIDEYMSQQKH